MGQDYIEIILNNNMFLDFASVIKNSRLYLYSSFFRTISLRDYRCNSIILVLWANLYQRNRAREGEREKERERGGGREME